MNYTDIDSVITLQIERLNYLANSGVSERDIIEMFVAIETDLFRARILLERK